MDLIHKTQFILLFVVFVTTGCTALSGQVTPTLTPFPSPTLPLAIHYPVPTPTPRPSPPLDPTLATSLDNTQAKYAGGKDLLLSHGWTVTKTLGFHEIILPTTFLHFPGDFPLSIYWAYNNKLSSVIGLNFTPYLGTQVHAIVYGLEEDPPCLRPYTNARGIVLLSDGKLIGAWIDSGNNLNKSCSLTGKTFQNIINHSWGEWLVDNDIVNIKNSVDNKLAKMSPAQLVLSFYEAINKHDYKLAYAHYSREKLSDFLFTNLRCCVPGGEGELFQSSYEEAVGSYGIENIKSIEIDETTLVSSSSGEKIIKISGKIKYYRESPPHIVNTNSYLRFIVLEHEIDRLGYRISGIGTGP